jgi:hypothetical protein
MKLGFLKLNKTKSISILLITLVYWFFLLFILIPMFTCIGSKCEQGKMLGILFNGCSCISFFEVVAQLIFYFIIPIVLIYFILSLVIKK